MLNTSNEIDMLKEAIDNGELSRIIVFIDANGIRGEFGPNLESIEIDLEKWTLTIEDYFTEVALDLGTLRSVHYDDEMECWNYSFNNGALIVLNEW